MDLPVIAGGIATLVIGGLLYDFLRHFFTNYQPRVPWEKKHPPEKLKEEKSSKVLLPRESSDENTPAE